MTDLLGVMESWSDVLTAVRDEHGVLTEIRLADIVSGKPVPPRPSPRMRVSAEQACLMANASWPPVETEPLGQWLLRASGGFSARANSAMATGDPGVPLEVALDRVRAFYAARGLPAWAQVVVGSRTAAELEEDGWRLARPGEADSEFQIASVSRALRAVRRALPPDPPPATVTGTASPAWLANDHRARAHPDAAVAVLEGPAQVGFASVGTPLVGKGRVACDGDWAGITDVWVSPDHRRRGLGLVVMAALLEWAAERGATTAYLQVRGDNPAGLRLYESLGFATHHTYRYLTAPDG